MMTRYDSERYLTFLQVTSTRDRPKLLSSERAMLLSLSSLPFAPKASEKEGQPEPLSYFLSELKQEELH